MESACPSDCHNSSVMCGANGASSLNRVSYSSCTIPPCFSNAFAYIIKVDTAVLNLMASISSDTFFIVECIKVRPWEPILMMMASGLTTLPLDLLIFSPPSARIRPCEVRFLYGSLTGTSPKSNRNLFQKREYKRCKTVCSMPPLYQSTPVPELRSVRGKPASPIQYFNFSIDANSLSLCGSQ